MKKIKEFFEELGIQTVLVVEEDGPDFKELIDLAKEKELTNPEDRKELLECFNDSFDGFFLYDLEKFCLLKKEVVEDIRQEAKELLYGVIMNIEEGFEDDFYYDYDLDYIKISGEILEIEKGFQKREKGLEVLFPSWEMRKLFIRENDKIEEIQNSLINLIKKVAIEHQLYQRLYQELPELILKAGIQ